MRKTILVAALLLACGSDDAPEQSTGTESGIVTLSAGTTSSAPAGSDSGEGTAGPGGTMPSGPGDGSGPSFDVGNQTSGTGPGEDCNSLLTVTLRDFQSSHPDMEDLVAVDPGIVEDQLGADGLPIYAGGTAGTTHGQAAFDQWYRDVAGVNEAVPFDLQLTEEADGTFSYDSAAFFPLDDQAFGNEGNAHNYHFTLELHTSFTYEGGEVFTFRGDDDVFMFVGGRLGIDLGGVHGPLEATIDMDAMADQLGISIGQTYPLDFFFAERHTSESNFRIETSIGCFVPPVG